MIEWARVGQRVVCIDDDYAYKDTADASPKIGDQPTIRSVWKNKQNIVMFTFEEYVNLPRELEDGFHEPGFFFFRFKPIKEHKGRRI